MKQYKRAMRACNTILKKFPEHGGFFIFKLLKYYVKIKKNSSIIKHYGKTETLALKGLLLNCQNKKAEGLELVRKGIKLNINSHTSTLSFLFSSTQTQTQIN